MSKVLLTAGRFPVALDLARKFHRAGHTVVVADPFRLHACRFSSAVQTCYTIPSPRTHGEDFIRTLIRVIEREKIELLVPCFEEALYIAQAIDQFPKTCEVFCSPFEQLRSLHNKWHFDQTLGQHGLEKPATFLIERPEVLQDLDLSAPYALKAAYSRSALKMFKIEPGQPLPRFEPSPESPWVAQEWLEGKHFCTYTICRNGKVAAHATYPVIFAVRDRWCVSFRAVEHQPILDWVTNFVAKEEYHGQVGFDFVEADDGRIFALECNPRPTNGALLFNHRDGLANSFFDQPPRPLFPLVGTKRQIAIGFLAFGWRSTEAKRNPAKYLRALLGVKDIVFSPRDPFPWLTQPAVFATYIRRAARQNMSIAAMIMHDLEWNA